MIDLVLLIAGLVCLAAATLNVKSPINLLALGLLLIFVRGVL